MAIVREQKRNSVSIGIFIHSRRSIRFIAILALYLICAGSALISAYSPTRLLRARPAQQQGYTLVDIGSLGPPGAGWTLAHGINTLGQVTGESFDGTNPVRVFLYSNGAIRDLG